MESQDIKILVVDDEEIYTTVLEHILKPVYTVYTANSGQKAVEMAREIVPDLVLLDVLMPGLSGFKVFEELKKHEATRDIAVIFITGMYNTEDEERAFFLGAVDYINKPFINTIVMARVRIHTQIIRHVRTIEQECKIDALTSLANRRSFEEHFSREWDKAVRSQEELVLLFISTENRDHYIKTYGRSHGNLMTQIVAGVLRQTLEQITGYAARWSEDTFAVLFPRTRPEGAVAISGIIRSNINNTVIPCTDGTKLNVSVLMELNPASPTVSVTAAEFLAECEHRLLESELSRNEPAVSAEEAVNLSQPELAGAESREQLLASRLASIPALGAEQAISAMGNSQELYEKVFWLVVRAIPQNIEMVKRFFFTDHDLPSFWIKMHGMKGSLRQIGCWELSKLAESLEWAAKAGDEAYCTEQYAEFEKQLLAFHEQAIALSAPEAVKQSTEPEDLRDYRQTLEQAAAEAEDYQCVQAAELLSELTKRHFSDQQEQCIAEAYSNLTQFQAQKALKLIEKLLSSL